MQNLVELAGGVSLRDTLPSGRIADQRDIRVTSCCSDSRRCRPGDLFVALVGSHRDGHEFAQDAVRRGAAAVLAERLLPVDVPLCIVPDTREAFGRLCQGLAGRPSEPMRVIGVAGSSGKTTTSALIASTLEAARRRVGAIHSIRYHDSIQSDPAQQTTPTQPELAHWMARMAANACSHAVIEVSRQALAERRVAGVQFDAIVLTGSPARGPRPRGAPAESLKAETRLLDQLKPGGFAVVNTDDLDGRRFLSSIRKPSVTVAMNTPAELTGSLLERHRSEQTFLVTAGSETVPVRTRMIGLQHVYNCLAASAVGLVLGLDLTTIVRGLESVDGLPGRLERIECGQPFGVFLDYADTPPLLAAALRALRPVTPGRLICVFDASAGQRKEQRPLMGRVAERLADLSIITTNRRRGEAPLPVIHEVLDGCARPGRAQLAPDRRGAIEWALSQARNGDTVLVAGLDRGHELTLAAPDCLLDDRSLIRRWLYEAGASDKPSGRPLDPSLRRWS